MCSNTFSTHRMWAYSFPVRTDHYGLDKDGQIDESDLRFCELHANWQRSN